MKTKQFNIRLVALALMAVTVTSCGMLPGMGGASNRYAWAPKRTKLPLIFYQTKDQLAAQKNDHACGLFCLSDNDRLLHEALYGDGNQSGYSAVLDKIDLGGMVVMADQVFSVIKLNEMVNDKELSTLLKSVETFMPQAVAAANVYGMDGLLLDLRNKGVKTLGPQQSSSWKVVTKDKQSVNLVFVWDEQSQQTVNTAINLLGKIPDLHVEVGQLMNDQVEQALKLN